MMLGQVSGQLRQLQYHHLLNAQSIMAVDDWLTAFINKLLHIMHGQWIYRNISKHHNKLGSIRRTERRQLLLEIDKLIHLPPEAVPEESKFLLEVDFVRLRQGELTSQHYWVHAVKAAVVAGKRQTQRNFTRRRRRFVVSSSNNIPTAAPPIPFGPTDIVDYTERKTALKRRHGGSGSLEDASNKRRRPD